MSEKVDKVGLGRIQTWNFIFCHFLKIYFTVLCLQKNIFQLFVYFFLSGKKPEHLNMLEGGIIAKLLEEKWTTFANMIFLKRLSIHLIHLLCISIGK